MGSSTGGLGIRGLPRLLRAMLLLFSTAAGAQSTSCTELLLGAVGGARDPISAFSLSELASDSSVTKSLGPFLPAAEHMLGIHSIREALRQAATVSKDSQTQKFLNALGVSVKTKLPRGYSANDLAEVLEHRPVLIVAEHPTGGRDGLAVHAAVSSFKSGVFILGHDAAARVPIVGDHMIPLKLPKDSMSPQELRQLAVENIEASKRVDEVLKKQGGVVVFPSGEIATKLDSEGRPQDGEWKSSALNWARKHHALVLPVNLQVPVSPVFNLLPSSKLRRALQPRLLVDMDGEAVLVNIGPPMDAQSFIEGVRVSLKPSVTSKDVLSKATRRLQEAVELQDWSELFTIERRGQESLRRLRDLAVEATGSVPGDLEHGTSP